MLNLLKRIPKKAFAAVAVLAIVAGVVTTAVASFGPDRPTRVWSTSENGFQYVTFNSYTGVPNGIGDERDFLRGVQVGRDSQWSDPVNSITTGSEVEMKIFIHNNADPLLNDAAGQPGVAKNVKVRAELPTGASQAQEVKSFISADNANPKEILDTLSMTGANSGFFELDFVPGSAKMYNHETKATTAIADTLVTTGVNLGDQKGCFKYVREITFRVKVKMPRYQTQKSVRNFGEDSTRWRDTANTKVGEKVEWEIWFKNSGTTKLEDVVILDQLPPHVTVVKGSIKLYKGTNSMTVSDSAIQNNGRQINVNTGDYNPGNDAYLVFATTVNNDPQVNCGTKQLINVGYATPEGYKHINDSARINVVNTTPCEEPEEPSYVCESLTVEKLGGRKVRATVVAPATGGAKLKTVTFNYGDGTAAKVTDKLVDTHEYKADGTYKITATTTFTVDGKDKVVNSENCTEMVTFDSEKPVEELPKTGAGSLIGLFTATAATAGVAHNVVTRRRK